MYTNLQQLNSKAKKLDLTKIEPEAASFIKEFITLTDGLAKVNDACHVVGITSWEGWDGKLISVDEEAGRAVVEVDRKKSGKVSYPTNLWNVRKGPAPKKSK